MAGMGDGETMRAEMICWGVPASHATSKGEPPSSGRGDHAGTPSNGHTLNRCRCGRTISYGSRTTCLCGRTWYAASVRASVERGDPLALRFIREHMFPSDYLTFPDGSTYTPPLTAFADEPEADPPQAVTADPEVLDTQADGDYGHAMTHGVESDGRFESAGDAASRASHVAAPPLLSHDVGLAERRGGRTAPASVEAGSTPATNDFDRAGFLARVQRIDPRVRRP